MKRTFAFLIVILFTNLLFAQTKNYTTAIENFQTNFNAERYDEIFASFSPEMKQALSLENTKKFLADLRNNVGKIESKEYVYSEQGTYIMYKTKFQKAIMEVNISLNEQNQINGLFTKPFKEPATKQNKTINALSSYPKEIAGIVFAKTKELPNNTQLSIAINQNEKTNYYGIIKLNDTIKPIENQHEIFEIGSITKVFTSTILASLVEDKKSQTNRQYQCLLSFYFQRQSQIKF